MLLQSYIDCSISFHKVIDDDEDNEESSASLELTNLEEKIRKKGKGGGKPI